MYRCRAQQGIKNKGQERKKRQVTTTHPSIQQRGRRDRKQKTGLPMDREGVDRDRLPICTAKEIESEREKNTGLPISTAEATDRARGFGPQACPSAQQRQQTGRESET